MKFHFYIPQKALRCTELSLGISSVKINVGVLAVGDWKNPKSSKHRVVNIRVYILRSEETP